MADTSPVVLLAKIGLLSLVPKMTGRLIIPSVVLDEIGAGPSDDPARQGVAGLMQAGLSEIVTPTITTELTALHLGTGETAVLAEALQRRLPAVTAVLDDQEARSAARALGIRTIGTAGILIRAKDGGHITEVRPYLHLLRAAGMWASDAFYRQVAHGLGEEWP